MGTIRISSDRGLAGLFLLALAIVAAWAAIRGIAPGEVRLLACPFHALTEVACPGCGMTRACIALAHGDLSTAWSFHPFAYLLVSLSIAVLIAPRQVRAGWRALPGPSRSLAVGLGIASCLLLWWQRAI